MPIVDFHNHLMPGVDDGAQTVAESESAIAAFLDDDVGAMVVTPHVDAALSLYPAAWEQRLAELDAGWSELTALCAAKFPQLEVYRAAELLLDLPEPDLSDPRVRINGGSYFLVEFPFMAVPPQSVRALGVLRKSGYIPILAHPERYHGITQIEIAGEWREAGAHLQINGGSLLGRYGTRAQQTARELLRRGWVDYVCSDFHARGAPLIRDYRRLLEEAGGHEQARILTETNPARMLRGEAPLPVAPLLPARASVWQRMGRLFR